MLASGQALAEWGFDYTVSHVLGGILHGSTTGADPQGSSLGNMHGWTEHSHGGKGLSLFHRHPGTSGGHGHCTAFGTGNHIHCSAAEGGVYYPYSWVSKEVPLTPSCSDDSAAIYLTDGHGICSHGGSDLLLRTLDHIPAASLVAGDDATLVLTASAPCDDPCVSETALLKYETAAGWETAVPSSTTATTYTFDVPGDAVRYPQLNYYFEIDRCTTDGCSSEPLRLPSPTTQFEVSVENRIRMRFLTASGQPAGNLRVHWGPQGTDEGVFDFWQTTTDSEGRIDLLVDPNEAAVSELETTLGYMNVQLSAFDYWPSEPIPEGTTDVRTIYASHVGTIVNLGNPHLPAAPQATQDVTFVLRQETAEFGPPPSASTTCTSMGFFVFSSTRCKTKLAEGARNRHIAYNIGGDEGFTTKFRYSKSESSSSTFGWGTKDGQSWTEADGEVTTENSNSSSVPWEKSGAYNYAAWIEWYYREYKVVDYDLFGSYERRILVPNRWSGQSDDGVWPNQHGFAKETGGPDCTINAIGGFTVAKADGLKLGYTISLGTASALPLNFRMRYQASANQTETTTYTWDHRPSQLDENGNLEHMHLFVPGAWKENDAGLPQMYCPPDLPGDTWTDTSDHSKINTAPVEPPG